MCGSPEETCFQVLVLSTDFPLCPERVLMNNNLKSFRGGEGARGVTFPCMWKDTNGFLC